jgi:hypothetical protein
VLTDGVEIVLLEELRRLCDALTSAGEHAAVILPQHPDRADLVFESLLELSIRYHPLANTSPNIVDCMVFLAGDLELEAIREAGLARRETPQWDAQEVAGTCVRYLVEGAIALRRERPWFVIEMLRRVRDALIEL